MGGGGFGVVKLAAGQDEGSTGGKSQCAAFGEGGGLRVIIQIKLFVDLKIPK